MLDLDGQRRPSHIYLIQLIIELGFQNSKSRLNSNTTTKILRIKVQILISYVIGYDSCCLTSLIYTVQNQGTMISDLMYNLVNI